jgi:hypothetical protein
LVTTATIATAKVPAVTGATFADDTVTLTGTSAAGSIVFVYEGLALVGQVLADSTGEWSMTGAAALGAFHSYGVAAVDADGDVRQSTSDYVPTATPVPPPVKPTDPPPVTPTDPPTDGSFIYVVAGDSPATIQSKLNSLQVGGTLVFQGNTTFDLRGTTITGKSGVTILADGVVNIVNGPGAGTSGAFDFSNMSDWTIRGRAPGQGFVFDGSLVNAVRARDWAVGNCTFNNQSSNGYDGSAIRMNNGSFGTVINNDFNNVQGNVLGMYSIDNITFDGNHFTDCRQPISIQEPSNADRSLGRNILITRNVFLGTERAAIEVGPSSAGAEYFSNLTVSDNFFDDFNNSGGAGTLLPISLVGHAAENTTVTGNFIRRGPTDAGEIAVAIEMAGSGDISNNTIVNFAFAILAYESGWNAHDNSVYNDGSSPFFGVGNNGRGTGTLGALNILSEVSVPSQPERSAW